MNDFRPAQFQFSVRAMLWFVLSFGVGLGAFLFVRRHPEAGSNPIAAWKILLAEIIAGALAFAMYRDWLNTSPRRGSASSLAVVALHLYIPFGWLVLCDYPWSQYHLRWLVTWPVLPGILPEAILFHAADRPFLVMGTATLALLGGLTRLGTYGRACRLAAAALALAVSAPSAWVAYWLFRF